MIVAIIVMMLIHADDVADIFIAHTDKAIAVHNSTAWVM